MALQSTVVLNIANNTQSISYTLTGPVIDQISYASGAITLATTSLFTLSKSDSELYITMLNAFINLLIANFPSVQNARGLAFPVAVFKQVISGSPIDTIEYKQTMTSSLISVYDIIYNPLTSIATFNARTSITVSLQEFFMTGFQLNILGQQIALN